MSKGNKGEVHELFKEESNVQIGKSKFAELRHNCTIAEAEEDLQAQLRPFSRHVYNIRRQFQELRHLKEQLSQDEIIIHEDFSENFQLKHQREIMKSHWSNESDTVFTAVVYYKDDNKDLKHLSYVLISDELSHDKI